MKKFAMLMLCLVLVFALAACAGTDTTPQGSVSDTVTVTDMKGEVAIPANPQRIVDVAGLTEELLILDMKVIASANTSMFDGVSVPKHLTTLFAERGIEVVGNYSGASSTGDLNLEKIAELKPDLIIMNIRHEKVYEQLAAIAPTVMIDDDISYVNWRGRFQQLGQWFDKEAAVEKWLADYDAKAAELAARIRDMIGDETFAVLEANSVHFGSYYIYRSGGPGEHRAGPAGAGGAGRHRLAHLSHHPYGRAGEHQKQNRQGEDRLELSALCAVLAADRPALLPERGRAERHGLDGHLLQGQRHHYRRAGGLYRHGHVGCHSGGPAPHRVRLPVQTAPQGHGGHGGGLHHLLFLPHAGPHAGGSHPAAVRLCLCHGGHEPHGCGQRR